ncbi:MAG: hypothetical protein JWP94_491 [Mucilaginibacter sp.]|nr:hypothetical protein [Mucilaginibacter sp.]
MTTSTQKPNRLSLFWKAAFLVIPLIVLALLYTQVPGTETFWLAILQLVISLWFTILLFMGVTVIFGVTDFKKGVLNFLIGDTGTYSLSRLQAFIWAIVIMSSQFCLIFSLLFNHTGNLFRYYEPTFSQSAMWLLGLSLTSYVAVKGVTVNALTKNQNALNTYKTTPKWGDILVGPNGLDFSKCQMLIWTLLAICVFESKVYDYNSLVIHVSAPEYMKISVRMYEEYKSTVEAAWNLPYVPYLPWSFVVLMGLSQGVYVGKKLVPSFKLDDLKAAKQTELENSTAQLTLKKQYLSSILDNPNFSKDSPVDKISAAALNKQITDLQQQIADINGDINTINTYNKAN